MPALRRSVFGCVLAAIIARAALAPTAPVPDPARRAAAAPFGRVALAFVANRGQADPWARYVAGGHRASILFGPDGLSFRLSTPPAGDAGPCDRIPARGLCPGDLERPAAPDPLAVLAPGAHAGDAARGTVHAVALRFVGGRAGALPVAEAPTGGTVSIFRGPRERWLRGMPAYGRVVYRSVWPGIDVAFDGAQDHLKQTFVVHPGADPAAIRLAWDGARGLRVDGAGRLVVDTGAGPLVDEAPVAWQGEGAARAGVAVAYRLGARASGPGTVGGLAALGDPDAVEDAGAAAEGGTVARPTAYGFDVGAFDRTRPLVIDPAVLVYAGFVATDDYDRGLGIAVDAAGAAYVSGTNGEAAYVVKVHPDGTRLDYQVTLDGKGIDTAFDIDVDPTGAAYVAGATSSAEDSFPVAGGPDLTFNGGQADAYVAKLAPGGDDLVYAGYLGGAGADFAEGLVVDAAGHAYVHGPVESTEASFPTVVGPDLTQNGLWDGFVAKLKADPTAPEPEANYDFVGFVGGAGYDVLVGPGGWSSGHIGIDDQHNVYISGQTDSTEASFPDGDGLGDLPSFDRTFNGGPWDAYVVKVRADGTGLAYAGYVGGDDVDEGKGMAVDSRGAAYLTGNTYSGPDTFPVRVGPDLTYGGRQDAFVAKVRPDGTALELAGYLGGDGDDSGQAVQIGPGDSLYVAGWTNSDETTLPVAGGPDTSYNTPEREESYGYRPDAFVGRMKASPDAPDPRRNWEFLGYVGGAHGDAAYWLDVDAAGAAYLAGDTVSGVDTFPQGQGIAGMRHFGAPRADGDAFAAKVTWRPPPAGAAVVPWVGQSAAVANLPVPTALAATATRTPVPIATRTPGPTPLPTRQPTKAPPVPPGEALVYFDDFGDPHSGWPTFEADGDHVAYVDDTLELLTSEADRFVHAFGPMPRTGDGALTFDVERLDDGDVWFGFHLGPVSAGYFFWVFGDGRVFLVHRFGTALRPIRALPAPPHLHVGKGANQFRVERYGTRLVVYANTHQILDIDDPLLGEPGPVAFLLQADTTGGTVRIDNVMQTRWTADRPSPTAAPSPTATDVPPPTPTRAPRVLLRDDFSDPRTGWATSDDPNGKLRYVDGEFEISFDVPGRFAGSPAPRVRCADCTGEVTVRLLTAVLGLTGIVMAQNADGSKFVACFITNDGRFTVQQLDGAAWTTLVPTTRSPAVRTDAPNRLRAVRAAGRLTFYANDVKLTELDVPDLANVGFVGLAATSGQTVPFTVRFDDFELRENGAASPLVAAPAWGVMDP